MDDPKSDNENSIREEDESLEDNVSENSDEENSEDWNINFEEESQFWTNLKKRGFIYLPDICTACNIGKFEIKEDTKKNILNPYYIRCNNKKCRKKVKLRSFSFLKNIRNIPASVIFNILENFFLVGLNAQKIEKLVKEKYNKDIKIKHVLKILEK